MADMTAPAAHIDDLIARLRLEVTEDVRATIRQWLSEHGEITTDTPQEPAPPVEPEPPAETPPASGEAADVGEGGADPAAPA